MGTNRRVNRDYWLLWSGSGLSNLGDGIRLTALPLLAATLTRDPLAVSGVLAATTAPWIVFGPIGGSLVDRIDRKLLMTGGQTARGLVLAVLAILVATDSVTMAHLYITGAVIGLGEILVDTSSQAAIPQLAGGMPLEKANSRLIAAELVLNDLAGGPLGAFLFAAVAFLPFGVNAGTFLVGGLLIALIRTPMQDEREPRRQNMRSDIVEGLRFVWSHRFFRGLALVVAIANFSMGAGGSILVLLAIEQLGTTEAQYGLMVGIGAAGGLVGALVASRVALRIGRRWAMTTGTAVLAVGQLLLATAPDGIWATAGLSLGLLGVSLFTVVGRTLRQALTPDRLLGRVVASFRLVGIGALPIGALLGGWLARATGLRTPYFVSSALIALAAVLVHRVARSVD
ncbi:MAG TPA: MFS transporter [Acidimicrobiia bacterium]|nr:MFS transporter [Acidimicrobiia bacterium]